MLISMKFVRIPEYLLLLGRYKAVSVEILAELKKSESSFPDKYSIPEIRKRIKKITEAKGFMKIFYYGKLIMSSRFYEKTGW